MAVSLRAEPIDTRCFLRAHGEDLLPLDGVEGRSRVGHAECVRSLAVHEGRLILSRPLGADKTYVVDRVLFQRRALPPGKWELVYEGGFGAAQDCSDENGAVILMEEFLEKQLWTGDGQLWVSSLACPDKPWWSLTARMGRFVEATAKFVAGLLQTPIEWGAYQVTWPRAANSRYLWSLPDCYKNMKLTTFGGKPAKWSHYSMKAWCKLID